VCVHVCAGAAGRGAREPSNGSKAFIHSTHMWQLHCLPPHHRMSTWRHSPCSSCQAQRGVRRLEGAEGMHRASHADQSGRLSLRSSSDTTIFPTKRKMPIVSSSREVECAGQMDVARHIPRRPWTRGPEASPAETPPCWPTPQPPADRWTTASSCSLLDRFTTTKKSTRTVHNIAI
jgi:hypothetical protein